MPSSRKVSTRIWGSIERRVPGLVLGGLAVAVVAGVLVRRTVAEPPPAVVAGAPDQVAAFMRAKLAHSADVLEGLSLEDFDLIARGAQQLSLVSQDSNWQVIQTEDYARQSMEFRRACDGLRRAAKEKNLDAAVLAWMDVTMKCVQCHRYVRDEERAEGAGKP